MNFCDLARQYQLYKSEFDSAMSQVITNAAFIGGPDVKSLESELSEFCGAPFVITCANGTEAITAALTALDIGVGDEIIVPDFTFFATAEAVSTVRATPIFAEINPQTFNIDPDSVRGLITPRTKGIISVSLFGQIAEMDELRAICEQHGIWLLEDAAQSFGATQNGIRSCNLSPIATTSFFPAKPLGCFGDGGAIFCQDESLAQKIRLIVNHGSSQRYVHQKIGLNSRLDTLQAAVLRVKLRHFEQELDHRNRAAKLYSSLLGDTVQTPQILDGNSSAWAQYTIRTKHRSELQAYLAQRNIPSAIHYPQPLHAQPVYAVGTQAQNPHASQAAAEVLSLPMHGLIYDEEVQEVCAAIQAFFALH